MKTRRIIFVAAFALAATLCIAGSSWHYKCETPKCPFEGDLGIGGGMFFGQVAGYCTTCKKFVSITWEPKGATGDTNKFPDERKGVLTNRPASVGTIWNPTTGNIASLYSCPHCKKPFMEIDNMSLILG